VTDDPAPAIAREGWPIVAGFVLGGLVVSAITIAALYRIGYERVGYGIAAICLLVCVWCIWFFRDPPRKIPAGDKLVISPADGVVVLVDHAPLPAEIREALQQDDQPRPRIAVFMNVFNVHVNRAPVAGEVALVHHHAGKFFNASLDKASTDNERLSLALRMGDGRLVASVQIAGLIARRIVCRVAQGVPLRRGQRYGLIRFGSRVDVYLPPGATPRVSRGERAVAGETILAEL